jgi:hypothetical protein
VRWGNLRPTRKHLSMTLSAWVGLIGGLTGFASAIVSYLAFRRDQARLRIWLGYDYQVTSGVEVDHLVRTELAEMKALGETPPHALYYRDPDKTWLSVDVTNIGRRPIKIEKLGLVVDERSRPYHVLADFEPRVLAEGENVSQNADQAKHRGGSILAAFACDAAKRMHYGGFIGGGVGLLCRMKVMFGIKPFVR